MASAVRHLAYGDCNVPLGIGKRVMPSPLTAARLLQCCCSVSSVANPFEGKAVLCVNAGSGFVAALLQEWLGAKVSYSEPNLELVSAMDKSFEAAHYPKPPILKPLILKPPALETSLKIASASRTSKTFPQSATSKTASAPPLTSQSISSRALATKSALKATKQGKQAGYDYIILEAGITEPPAALLSRLNQNGKLVAVSLAMKQRLKLGYITLYEVSQNVVVPRAYEKAYLPPIHNGG